MTRLEFLMKHLQPGIILDIGNLGHEGRIHKMIMERFPESQVYGIDTDPQEKFGLTFPHQTIARAETMPYQDNFFDSIYMGEVLEHTWTPLQLVRECYRILKAEGILILDTPNVYALSRMARYGVMGKDVILGNPDHKIFFSRAMVENLLVHARFRAIETLSDSKITLKGRDWRLPRFGTLKYIGEHLLAVGRK